MEKERFKAIRKALGWSLAQTRDYLDLKSERAIRRYEDGTRAISGPVAKLMEMAFIQRPSPPIPKPKTVEWPTTVNFNDTQKEKSSV